MAGMRCQEAAVSHPVVTVFSHESTKCLIRECFLLGKGDEKDT